MEQAIDLVVAGKKAEGLRERTLKDYRKDWGYFVKSLEKNYDIQTVNENDAVKYEGHKYIKDCFYN